MLSPIWNRKRGEKLGTDAVGTCGCCCSSAAGTAQGCPDSLCHKTRKSCDFDHLLWLSAYSRLLSFTWSFFQQAHNFPQGWSIAPDPDSRLTQNYLVPLALLTWGMLLPPVCASWGNGVSTVWVVACRSCAGTPYSLYRLCFCWMWPPLSDCSQVKLCRIFKKMYCCCPCQNQLVRESSYTIFRRHFFNVSFLQLFESNDLHSHSGMASADKETSLQTLAICI